MKRLLVILLLPALSLSNGVAAARAADEKARLEIRVEEFAAPLAPRAVGASLATAPDGTLWISWVERSPNAAPKPAKAQSDHSGHHTSNSPAPTEINTLRFAIFDATAKKWRAPRTIVAAASVAPSASDFPQLALTATTAFAVWADGRGGMFQSHSRDAGATWSQPAPWTRESDEVEKFTLARLADGRVLAAWLDGRAKKSGGKNQQLFARVVDSGAPDMLVDASVCDCCQTTLTAFPDGGALLAYRARTTEEVRDIRTARFNGRTWDEPRPLNNDDWRINACPVNGPRLANDRGRVAAAWFTAADNDPRVLASYSPDAGTRFLQPLRLDRGQPLGRVDTVILRDGALLVTWVEQDGSLWLRRVSPDFAAGEAVQLASADDGRVNGFPRLALVRDYAGGRTFAQCLVAYVREDAPATLHTSFITVPEGDLVSLTKDCDCAPTAEQLLGLPLRGTVVAVEAGALLVRHGEIPGVLAAGAHHFQTAPEVLAAATVGREFFARAEARDGVWRVFDVRLLSVPAK